MHRSQQLAAALVACGIAAATGLGAQAGPPVAIAAKPPSQPTATPGGPASRIAFSQQVVQGKGQSQTTSLQVFVTAPDGSGRVQVTSAGAGDNEPMSWSADGWMAVEHRDTTGAEFVRILNVPAANPGGATEVLRFGKPAGALGGLWSGHKDGAGGVLPATQQLLAFAEGTSLQRNIVARRYDGGNPFAVTNYVTTCNPSQSPGCSGSRFVTYLFGWLPGDAAAQTIRVLYGLREWVYVDGAQTADVVSYRVARLGTASWPAVTVQSDDLLAFGGPAVTALNLTVSRDGSRAVYDENFDGANEPYLHMAPLEYNPATGITTLRSDLTVTRADTTGSNYTIYGAGGFSPDNSQLVLYGFDLAGNGGAGAWSVFVAGASTAGVPVQVDGSDRQARRPIWGP